MIGHHTTQPPGPRHRRPSRKPHVGVLAGLALALALAGGAQAGPVASPTAPREPLAPRSDADDLVAWLDLNGTRGDALALSVKEDYERILERVGQDAAGRGKDSVPARVALLTAAGWGLMSKRPKTAPYIRAEAQAVLASRLTPGRGKLIEDWLLYDLLSFPDRHEPVLRAVALRALESRLATDRVEPHLLVAIMTAGRDPDGFVRMTATEILQPRTERFVTDYFLGALERGEVRPEVFAEHLDGLSDKDFAAWMKAKKLRLFDYVRLRLEHPDWREASRSLALAPRFEVAEIVPLLIQGLGVWSLRSTGGSRRVCTEYQRALKTLTGYDFGRDPAVWARWWTTALAGGKLPELAQERPEQTEATFFDLRPSSDRILFLIDRSGSMRERQEGNRTRFQDAMERLQYTLRDLGPETQFGVVLFNSTGHKFRNELVSATPETLKELETWGERVQPDGGTDLHSGLRVALPGIVEGTTHPTQIPYDTIVVLCDGETESASWVAPWLAKYNLDARVAFHCVNIGGQPGGVLEALAKGSGGTFVNVETY
ncbi:MAG: VWA domain-containing protein [Planctomycetota bacterium]|nr:VWA domain-containing protein [Planctomycetota bacterium]